MTLTQFIPDHGCATWAASPYHIRSAQRGGLACNFNALNDYAAAERALSEIVRHRRYWTGDFYPFSEISSSEEIWAAWQLSLGKAEVTYAFRRELCGQDKYQMYLQAIEVKAE